MLFGYQDSLDLDIFMKGGLLVEHHTLKDMFAECSIAIKDINEVQLARLDWPDRHFEIVQHS